MAFVRAAAGANVAVQPPTTVFLTRSGLSAAQTATEALSIAPE